MENRVQQPVKPMEQLCMDIKYVYIHGEKRLTLNHSGCVQPQHSGSGAVMAHPKRAGPLAGA
ncbi:MAG: hypothetical protein M3342_01860 [Bacteroidota bacterium]|nr:hypothetical protein [Bacteroidota bacterium]